MQLDLNDEETFALLKNRALSISAAKGCRLGDSRNISQSGGAANGGDIGFLLSEAYSEVREDVLEERGVPETDFPAECPFSRDEVLSRSFLPES
jgi:hypothetical protein